MIRVEAGSITPLEAISRYRVDQPLAGETTRFTLTGLPPGAHVRQMRLLWLTGFAAAAAALALVSFTDLYFLLALLVGVVGTAIAAGLIAVVTVHARGGATSVAAVLTNERLLIAEGRPKGTATTRVDSDVEIAWLSVERVHSFWLREHQVRLVSLGGPGGKIVSVEMGVPDDVALDANAAEGGLSRRSLD